MAGGTSHAAAHVPLEYEHVGEITVVKLSDNIASTRECRSVEQQIDRLIAENHCDLVVDFSSIKKLNSGFRDVLLACHPAAGKPPSKARPYRSVDLPPGEYSALLATATRRCRNGPARRPRLGRAMRRSHWNLRGFRLIFRIDSILVVLSGNRK